MTETERAIAFLEEQEVYFVETMADDETASYYARAALALREKQEREDPQQLTLDELRKMDGQPVWITVSGNSAACNYSGWAIVGRYYDGTVALYVPCNAYYEAAIRHGTLIAYRFPPKKSGRSDQQCCSNQKLEAQDEQG